MKSLKVGSLLLLFLAWSSVALAQFGVEQPFFAGESGAGSIYYPTNEPLARYWWISEDATTNSQLLSWVDRIVSYQLTNTVALAPTNSALGVGFDGSHYLRPRTNFNTGVGLGDTGAVYVIFSPITPSSTHGSVIVGDSNVGNDGDYGLFTRSTLNNLWFYGGAGNGAVAKYASGTTLDVVVNYQSSAPNATAFYTNGLLSLSSSLGMYTKHGFVGWSAALNMYYIGHIKEIVWYGGKLPSTSISNLHWYATNKYGFSP